MGCASAFQAEEADSISARRSRFSGCRVMGAHLLWEQGGGGSNPLIPTSLTGSGLVLKAPVSGTGDRGLKSRLPDQIDAGLRSGSSVVSLVRQLTDSIPVPATIFGGPRRLTAGFLILDQGTRIRLPPRVRGRGGVGVLAALSMPRTPVRVRSSPPSFMACSSIGRMADFQSVKAGSTPAQATNGAFGKSLRYSGTATPGGAAQAGVPVPLQSSIRQIITKTEGASSNRIGRPPSKR